MCGVICALRSKGLLSKEDYFKIYTASEAPPSLYGLPKIHKLSVPLHPIISSVGMIIHNIAKFLVLVLAPLVGKMSSFIKDNRDFTNKVRELVLDLGEVMKRPMITFFGSLGAIQMAKLYCIV